MCVVFFYILSPVMNVCYLVFYIAGSKIIVSCVRISFLRYNWYFCDLDTTHSATGTGHLSVGMNHVVGKPNFHAFIRKALLS